MCRRGKLLRRSGNTVTAGLVAPKTSPTLVDFKNRNAPLPDWRIQVQNAVQQRKGTSSAGSQPVSFPANGSAALNAETSSSVPETKVDVAAPLVAKAMNRIAESRKVFSETTKTTPKPQTPQRPFGVVQPNGNTGAAAAPARVNASPKPTLVASPPISAKRDTNKLPPIAEVAGAQESISKKAIEADPEPQETPSGRLMPDIKRIEIKIEQPAVTQETAGAAYDDEIEDLAPFSMRFGAGLFDMIIAGFAAMLLLSPLAFTNSNWFSAAGLLTFVAAVALVSFIYMTLCLGFYGKTMGMRLFSLELVDAVENEYPTLRQAAVNSLLFLVSLGLLGAGFLTSFFNEERRAAHDLLSGTILVRDF